MDLFSNLKGFFYVISDQKFDLRVVSEAIEFLNIVQSSGKNIVSIISSILVLLSCVFRVMSTYRLLRDVYR